MPGSSPGMTGNCRTPFPVANWPILCHKPIFAARLI